ARGVTKRFPGVIANDRVTLEVMPGEVHALLGENGAGKTTLCNVLTGLFRPDEGHIEVRGEPVRFRSPREAHESGIFMVHQHFRTLREMAAGGAPVVFISHQLREVLAVSDRVTVLRGGKAMGTVATRESDAKSLARMMVGRDVVLTRKESTGRALGDVVLELSNVGAAGDLGTPALVDLS